MKYLITGNKGQLGKEFEEQFKTRRYDFKGVDIDSLDLRDKVAVKSLIESFKPDVVLNCAAYNLVDVAEKNREEAFAVNKDVPIYLAELSNKFGFKLVHYSTDYVFDGTKNSPYTENDSPNPQSIYGKSKYEGEKGVLEINKDALVLRLSWVYGDGEQNFIHKFRQWAKNSNELNITNDEISIPTSTKSISELTIMALQDKLHGLYHLTASGYCTRYEWAKLINKCLDLKVKLNPVSIESFSLPAKRPRFSAMSNRKLTNELGIEIPEWQDFLIDRINDILMYK